MSERVQHAYICQCKGHVDGDREFLAAPPEWFYSKGYSTPVWCPGCRKWRKAQIEEAVRCIDCGVGIRLSIKQKITVHRKQGPFKRPEKCTPCEKGRRKQRAIRVTRPQAPQEDPLKKLNGFPSEETVIELSTDEHVYSEERDDGDTMREHLEHHIAGHPNSQVGQIIKNRSRRQSGTALVPYGANFADHLAALAYVASLTDRTRVRQFQEGSYILKVFAHDSGRIEKVVIDPRGPVPVVVTSYDDVGVEEIVTQLKKRENQ